MPTLLDLMFDPAGMRTFVEEWDKVASGLLQRAEAVGQVLNTKLQELLKQLREYPGVAALKLPLAPQSPVLPIVFRRGKQRPSHFSLITTVGPANASTRRNYARSACFRLTTRRDQDPDNPGHRGKSPLLKTSPLI